ncbi:MAG: hypothetical protein EOP12_00665 [Pseudomonas sp.]|nr:MAG: hypothetical protein EOP12_00665 [Pseudomonas sp.]
MASVVAVFVVCSEALLAAPRTPASDTEVVESLPLVSGWSGRQRTLRRELAQRPQDERVAVEAARSYLTMARNEGDARYAGYAVGALQAWEALPSAQVPVSVLVMRATVAQFLHDFDASEAMLRAALARQPGNAQALITLATIQRVRGRYAESDAACKELGRASAGAVSYGIACLAENAGLRGDSPGARKALRGLLDDPAVAGPNQAGTRQWLLTSLAEVEELAGQPTAAEAAYREALDLDRSGYTLLAYVDFLLHERRPAPVASLLAREALSDAVLLRLAIAERSDGAADRKRPAAEELRSRFEAAALRPGSTAAHAREEALFALDVQGDAPRALALARTNVEVQREPIDLLIYARAAVAAGDPKAREDVKKLMQQMGLRDARIDSIL